MRYSRRARRSVSRAWWFTVPMAVAVGLAAGGSTAAAESWRHHDFGAIAFDAPDNLRSFGGGGGPGALTAASRSWDGVALTTSRSGAVENSLLLVAGWGEGAHAYSESSDVRANAVEIRLGERRAVRVDFILQDAYNNTRGIDIVVDDPPVYGRRFVLTCRGPTGKWEILKPTCDRIARSIVVRDAPETIPIVDPPKPVVTPAPAPEPVVKAGTAPPVAPTQPTTQPTTAKPTETAAVTPAPVEPPKPVSTGAAAAATGRRVALVIGNGAYVAAPKLPTPVNDAARMKAKLAGLGFEVIAGSDLGRGAMAADLGAFFEKARGAEVALFYFSGHGIQVRGHNYLLPTDADFTAPGAAFDVEARALDLQKFLDAGSDAKVVLAFIDACRDNPVVEEKLASTFYKGLGGPTKGLAVVPKEAVRPNQFIVFASEEGKTAQTGASDVSVFTAALLSHLGVPGEDVSVAYRKIRAEVERSTSGQQSPRSVDDLRGEMILAPR
mgnify:CR=1 FL=1